MYKKPIKTFHKVRQADSLNTGSVSFETLGDKIVKAFSYGADMGEQVSVQYDCNVDPESKDYKHEVDVLSEPNADFFDIAEQFGEMVEQSAPPQETNE